MTKDSVRARLAAICCYASLGLVALLLLAGAQLQSSVHLNHDVAWIARSAGWLLDGQRLGVDVLDPSPPLAWYLSLPAAAMYRSGLAQEVDAIRLLFWSLCAGSLLLCFKVLLDLPKHGRCGEWLVLIVSAAAAFCILPTRDFGQRDVVAIVLGMPYVFLIASRLEFGTVAKHYAITAGLAAGVGFALKPFLLIIPALLELLRLVRMSGRRRWLMPESVSLAAVCAAYGLIVLVISPEYVRAVPVIKAVYWAYDNTADRLLLRLEVSIAPLVLGVAIAAATRAFNSFHLAIGIACLGAVASYWAQGKGFTYHAFPILATGWILLAYSAYVGARSLWSVVAPVLGSAVSALAVLGTAFVAIGGLSAPVDEALDWYRSHDIASGEQGRLQQSLIDALRNLGMGPGEYAYALTTHPGPAFPAVSYLGAEWAGRAATQFIIPAYVRREEIADETVRRTIVSLASSQADEVSSAIRVHRPRVVLVDDRPRRLGLGYRKFDFIGFYSRDEEFRQLWTCYVQESKIGGMKLFVRIDDCDSGYGRPGVAGAGW